MPKVDAVDFANYTVVPSVTQIECLKRQGVTRAIVGASYGTKARAQLEACINGGIRDVEVYAWISHPFNASLITRALEVSKGLPIKKIWLDAEAPVNGRTPTQVVQDIRDAISFVKLARPDLNIGIYTGGWWWVPYTGNYKGKDICSYDLWIANYRDPTNYPFERVLTGGWTVKELDLWQYAGTVQFCNLNVDLNVVIPRSNRMYSDEQIDKKFNDQLKAIGGLLSTITQHGYWITENRGLIKTLAEDMQSHVNNHSGAFTDEQKKEVQETLQKIDDALAGLGEKLQQAATEILAGN